MSRFTKKRNNNYDFLETERYLMTLRKSLENFRKIWILIAMKFNLSVKWLPAQVSKLKNYDGLGCCDWNISMHETILTICLQRAALIIFSRSGMAGFRSRLRSTWSITFFTLWAATIIRHGQTVWQGIRRSCYLTRLSITQSCFLRKQLDGLSSCLVWR